MTSSGLPPTTGLTNTSGGVSAGRIVVRGRLATLIIDDRGFETAVAQERTFGTTILKWSFLGSASIQTGLCPHSPARGRFLFWTGKPTNGIPKASTVSSYPSGLSPR